MGTVNVPLLFVAVPIEHAVEDVSSAKVTAFPEAPPVAFRLKLVL